MVMKLDFASATPIYQQIRDQIVQAVADGAFTDGDRLPTIRALASEAGINTMTVNKAYQLLKQEGYILADRRNGARVREEFGCGKSLSGESQELLRRLICEAKISGMSKEEFIRECEKKIKKMQRIFAVCDGRAKARR